MALRLLVEINGWSWDPKPDIDESGQAVLAIASGDWEEAATAAWLRTHLRAHE